ncbi:MAG: hypothetical protein IKW62_06080 [Clostridia bacterium]|nr:hypothetical protein [Clostridia bacterium]
MFLNLFKNRPRYVDVEVQGGEIGNRRNKVLIIVIIIAILILAFGNFGGKDKEVEDLTKDGQERFSTQEYINENERRLEEILSMVRGAGKVKAMITVSELGEKVVASDKKSETTQDAENEKTARSSAQEQTTVIYGSGAEEKPFVVKEKLPLPAGVLVVATGAGDENVRLEIYEAVKALYGLSGHRVKVTTGNIK